MLHFEIFAIHLLEILFLAGLLGSVVVVAISFVEDIGELFSSDETPRELVATHLPRT